MIDRIANHWPALLVALTGLSFMGQGWIVWRDMSTRSKPPVVEYTDVRFLEQIAPYSWWMEKVDGPFRADFCHDFDVPALNFQPGEVAWRLKFQDMGNCWSIKDGDVRFYRDKKRWTVTTSLKADYNTALKEIKANE